MSRTLLLCAAVVLVAVADHRAIAAPDESSASAEPQPKDPSTALWLSLGPTLGGLALEVASLSVRDPATAGGMNLVGGIAAFVGPSLGHAYSGRVWNRGLGIRLAGLATALVGVGLVMSACSDGCGHAQGTASAGGGLFIGGGIVYVVGVIDEISGAPDAARRYNREHGFDATLTFAPIVTAHSTAPGLGLVGRF
jgi:hypothetical protein